MGIEIVKFFQGMESPFWDAFWSTCTMLGEEVFIVVVLITVYYAINKDFGEFLFYGFLSSLMVNATVKNIVKADRPFQVDSSIVNKRPQTSGGFSFPSGHTQGVTSLFSGMYIYSRKLWLLISGLVAAVLVAISRMYLGVHFPRDVICGFLFAIASVTACYFLRKKTTNKFVLYIATAALFVPMLFFAETSDFFKNYGMLVGFIVSVFVENKFIGLEPTDKLWKKIVRVAITLALVLAVKEGVKLLYPADFTETFFLGFLRYMLMTVVGIMLCSFIFKKAKL